MYIYLFLPLILGFLTSFIVGFNKTSRGKDINARPPPYVFSIVWTILYLFIGYSWMISLKTKNNKLSNILYILLVFLLSLWLVVYKKNIKSGLYTIFLCILVTFLVLVNHLLNRDKLQSFLITPLLVWLLFASMLNYTEVNKD